MNCEKIGGKHVVEVTWWSVAVIIVSIIIDISRARALKRVAKKTNSQALEADALHFSSDVLSSTVVLIGPAWPKCSESAFVRQAAYFLLIWKWP